MWWPIRNQIFVPFAGVLMVTVTTIAVSAAVLAARRSEQQTIAQLHRVIEVLGQSNFPYSSSVLEKMRGLSGAHFIVWGRTGQVVASTIPVEQMTGTELRSFPVTDRLASLVHYPTLELQQRRYRAAAIQMPPTQAAAALWVLYPEQSWQQARWDAALPPLAVGAVTIVLMLLVSAWLAQRLSRRIRSVESQVAAIAAGDFREVQGDVYHDEIQELVRSVNQMSRQLRLMRDAIRQSERTRLLGQLAGGLAHQLRNAVTGARMAVQIHVRRCRLDAQDESLCVALRQLSLTEEQVKGFLSLGRSQLRHVKLYDPGHLLKEVVTLIGPNCEHARVDLQSSIPPGLPKVPADAEGLRAAILNLALNAIEAAGTGGTVWLAVLHQDDEICWEVADNGPGPVKEVAGQIFDPFVTDKPEGVGLGLALAQQVASDHAGRLDWERSGGNTVFRLHLPLAIKRFNSAPDMSAPDVAALSHDESESTASAAFPAPGASAWESS